MGKTYKACAKINLGLYITEKRTDNYHNIETAFYPIPLYDLIQVRESDTDGVTIKGIALECATEDNLVIKAIKETRKTHDLPPIHVTLEKNIPFGAGLGGGSSDAACVIKALNTEFSLGMSEMEMENIVSKIGADCAFFIKSRPTIAKGIGNEFEPLDLNLSNYYIMLVKPDESVPTKEAYANVTPKLPDTPLRETLEREIEVWVKDLHNDFEKSVFTFHPTLPAIKEKLYSCGATYASMSGSGSCMFGLFLEDPSKHKELFYPCFVHTAKLETES